MAEERLEEAAKDMRNQMTAVAQQVFSNAGISQFFDSFDVTTDEGLQKASTALSAISAVKSATDAIKSPLSEMEQQAQSAKAAARCMDAEHDGFGRERTVRGGAHQ